MSQNSECGFCGNVSVQALLVIGEGYNFGYYFLIGNFYFNEILDGPRQLVPGFEAVVLC